MTGKMSEIVIKEPGGKASCKSVGMIVKNKDGEIALLDRRKEVLGWACPAGHIDSEEGAEVWRDRELAEETGIAVRGEMALVLHADINNACKRGFDEHEWFIYAAEAESDRLELKEPENHKGIGWFKPEEIRHLELEPVWRAILERAGVI
ncbi:MAG: NUDIX hydrolase [Patescibacteria group bacterium]